jgi:glutamine synthetase
LDSLEQGENYVAPGKTPMEIGVTALPHFTRHTTDRNRTSPFAFTGNKFEFRMLGSAFSLAEPNTVLNTALAESLRKVADALEPLFERDNFNKKLFNTALSELIRRMYKRHKRIVFNGNNYSAQWLSDAEKRGLPCVKTTVDALDSLMIKKNIDLYEKHKVFTENELKSHSEILTENYCKTVHIEALTMTELTRSEIVPACIRYQNELAKLLLKKKELLGVQPVNTGQFKISGGEYSINLNNSLEENLLKKVSDLCATLFDKLTALENAIVFHSKEEWDILLQAVFYRDTVISAMAQLREVADKLEGYLPKDIRTLPSYGEMLFSVN